MALGSSQANQVKERNSGFYPSEKHLLRWAKLCHREDGARNPIHGQMVLNQTPASVTGSVTMSPAMGTLRNKEAARKSKDGTNWRRPTGTRYTLPSAPSHRCE